MKHTSLFKWTVEIINSRKGMIRGKLVGHFIEQVLFSPLEHHIYPSRFRFYG